MLIKTKDIKTKIPNINMIKKVKMIKEKIKILMTVVLILKEEEIESTIVSKILMIPMLINMILLTLEMVDNIKDMEIMIDKIEIIIIKSN